MDEDETTARFKKLGFKPQKENVYNKLLPYGDKLDAESTKLFVDIKTNLIKSVLAREMRPGCALWTSRLNKYMKIYGLKFSKEDHIALIKLFYELLTIPSLEPTRINKFASTLSFLLKKKYLLSRDDLQLEWRPLYDLYIQITDKSKTDIGMYRYIPSLENAIENLIRVARIYFPASATQEMLDEFRPQLCPFNSANMMSALAYLEMFLPICVKPEEAPISYGLWFEEFMDLWNVCHNASSWERFMATLIAKLGSHNIGYINWEPYIPIMFVRFLRTLQLPVGYKKKRSGKLFKIDITSMALWIISTLGGEKDTAFFHLEKFMQTLETYYHPANNGSWTTKLRELLSTLSLYFVQRVHFERYHKYTWETQIPDNYKLTDEDITRFVNIMKPCIEQAVFSKQGMQYVKLAMQYLASLRPEIIVPIMLDKLYASMDSLTEPHRLTSSMVGVVSVARYMVQGAQYHYPEGPTHVIPLLYALLPGIDPNDFMKSFMTFGFISNFISMCPVVNSSEASNYYDDLTEEEHIVCEATAGFEDFILQFFDRLCVWIEANSLELTRLEQLTDNSNKRSRSDSLIEASLISVTYAILGQCSPEIFTAALRKVFNFAKERILEVKISGKMIAAVCQCFSMVNAKETLKLFVPYLCDAIETLIGENEDILTEEHLDDEFLYNLLLLSKVVDARSDLLNYIDRLNALLERTLHMTSQQGCRLAAGMLELMMSSLTFTQPTEYRSSNKPFTTHIKDFLTVREWGAPGKIKDLNMSWYVPGETEIGCVRGLLNKYLVPELDILKKFSTGEISLSRENLRQSLRIVIAVLASQTVLPLWEEPALQLVDSVLDPWAFHLIVGGPHIVTMPDGSNVRKTVADIVHDVQKRILEVDEGDTLSIQNVVQIYDILLFNKYRGRDFELHWKTFHMQKKALEDKLHKGKLHLRHVLIDRVMLHQEFRNESRSCSFTATHRQIMLDLFELGVSRYSETRILAQAKLLTAVSTFPYSYTIFTPKFKEILQMDSIEHHEKFKGCLNILLGPKTAPIIARHDWKFIRDVWPLLIKSMPSEKPSIVNLINNLSDAISRWFPTIAIKLVVPKGCLDAAYVLGENSKMSFDDFQSVIRSGEDRLLFESAQREKAYNETVDLLLEACVSGNLHWLYNSTALNCIRNLVHKDVKYNPKVVRFFLNSLISESIVIRKIALKVALFILIQNKPKFKKTTIDPYSFSTGAVKKCVPGIRSDNHWLLYNSQTVPKTAQHWDELRFVHDMHSGYYAWPKKLEVYVPSGEQPTAAKRMNDLSEQEKEIYNFFNDNDNITLLIKYLSMEEKKGKDRFCVYRLLVFKNLFKIFEDKLLDIFIPHLEKLVSDKQEHSQRCAAEIISGIVRGSKHWSFEKVEHLWKILIPLLRTAISNMSDETLADWSVCMDMNLEYRDPNRQHWILEYLMNDPLSEQTSFLVCGRLCLLQSALNQQPWRNAELLHRLFTYLQAHLAHPFQNVRDKISSCLTVIFGKDIIFPGGSPTNCPKVKDLFDVVMPKLNLLYIECLKKVDSTSVSKVDHNTDQLQINSLDSDDQKESIKLFKTVSKYITSSLIRSDYSVVPEYFQLLPLLCVLQNSDTDDELDSVCSNLLAVLAHPLILDCYIPPIIEAIKNVANCPFWSARAVIAEFLQVLVFYNMATIVSREEWVLEVQKIVLTLLEDPQPEVRVKASKFLSGLLHCQFILSPEELLTFFKQKAKTKIKKPQNLLPNSIVQNNGMIRVRHAGVLGLCAFVDAHPYDVPDFLPDVFGHLGPHLTDPQPIPATIRKTLEDFKRTHLDNWEVHKLKFTEEELSVLSDLTVPPSYYV